MFNYLSTEKGKITTKVLAVLLIITLTLVNFIVLGSNIGKINISFAADADETSESNVRYSVYLDEGKTTTETITDINNQDLKLYVTVEVKNQGSLENATLNFANTNFYLKSDNTKTSINLGTIQAGTKLEKVYNIVPKTDTQFNLNWLNMDSVITLTGSYKSDDGTSELKADDTKNQRKVNIKLDAPTKIGEEDNNNHKINLNQEFITNQILTVNGFSKRVIQEMVCVNVNNNSYPTKSTYIEATNPISGVTPELVKVATYGTAATNGKYLEFGTKEDNKAGYYEYDSENKKVKITVNNNADENNCISWEKNTADVFVITYVYPEITETKNMDTKITAQATMYTYLNNNNNYASAEKEIKTTLENKSINPEISVSVTGEIFKGNMNLGKDTEFMTLWQAGISDANLMDTIILTDGSLTDEFNKEAGINPTTYYKATYINVEEMKNLLGEDGTITIIGDKEYIVNKDTSKGENQFKDYYKVEYTGETNVIMIKTSNPVKEGIITVINDKALKSNENVKNNLDKINKLITQVSLTYGNGNDIVGGTDSINVVSEEMAISNTVYAISAEADKKEISTTQATDVNFTITLKQDSAKYTLYKNPVITVELPEYIDAIECNNENVSLLNADGIFEIESTYLNNTYDKPIIQVELKGESTAYGENPQILIKAKLKTDSIMPTTAGTVNVSVSQNNNAIASKSISLNAKAETTLLTATAVKVGENDIQTAFKENITAQTIETENKEPISVNVTGTVINNMGSDLTNAAVIGKLDGNLGATLKNINANATISYTADNEVAESSNWVSEMPAKATGYKLVFDSMKNTETKKFNLILELPVGLTTNKSMDVAYTVIAGTTRVESPVVTLNTPQNAKLELTVTPSVENNETVYEGQTLSYEVKVKNTGDGTVKNINVSNIVPEGTTLVSTSASSWTIASLEAGKEETKTMQLTVNNLASGETEKEINVKTTVTQEYLESELTNNVKNVVKKSPLLVSFALHKNYSDIVLNDTIIYRITIKNNSNEDIENLKIENIVPNELEYEEVIICSEDDEQETKFNKVDTKYSLDNVNLGKNQTKTIEIEAKIVNYNKNGLINNLDFSWGDSKKATFTDVRNMVKPSTISLNIASDKTDKELNTDDIIEYNVEVKNEGFSDTKVDLKINLTEGLELTAIKNSEEDILVTDEMKQNGECIITEEYIEKNKSTNIKITAKVVVDQENISENKEVSIQASAIRGKYIEESNKLTNIVKKAELKPLTVTMSSSKADKEVNTNDVVEYYVLLLNANKKDITTNVKITLSNSLAINKIETVNDTDIAMTKTDVDNKNEYTINDIIVPAENTVKLKVTSTVTRNQNDLTSNLTLSAKAVAITDETQQESNIINCVLKKINSDNPDKPDNPDNPDNPDKPDPITSKYFISGKIWLDENKDGLMGNNEKGIKEINVNIKNALTGEFLKDNNGNLIKTTTNSEGVYKFEKLDAGKYILVFDCDVQTYGVTTGKDSVGVIVTEEGNTFVKTDTIEIVDKDIINLNIGLVENPTFDLQLDKYVSKITVQNVDGTTTYNYNKTQLAKAEISSKKMAGSVVVVEYTIDVTNKGEIPGYVDSIVDYVSPEYTFSSELNTNWYEGADNYLYDLELGNEEIMPGETKSVTLVLTKTMTNTNTGLITNTAEISEAFNEFAFEDVNSIPGNMEQKENDMSSADVIISVKTGGTGLYIGIFIASLLILGGGIYLVNKKVIAKKDI